MRLHRHLWVWGWGSVTGLAAITGALIHGVGVPVVLALVVGVSAFALHLAKQSQSDQPPPGARWTRARVERAFLFAAKVAAGTALTVSAGALLGGGIFVLLVTAAVTSPQFGTWLYPHPAVRPRRARRRRREADTTGLHVTVTAAALRAAVEILDDDALCRGWRDSYVELGSTTIPSDQLELVNLRQAYLDEMERRDDAGLHAWLESGPRAIGDPSTYLRTRRDGPRPDRPSTSPDEGQGPDDAAA